MDRADAENGHPQRRLRGVSLAVVTSLVFHVILVAVLSLLMFEPQIISPSIVTELLPETEQGDIALSDVPLEMSDSSPATSGGQLRQLTDFLAENDPGDVAVTDPAVTGGTSRAFSGTGDALLGFSATAAGRLKKNAIAKRGDYEIALFWDGPSDLDLHVLFQSGTGRASRVINFLHRGTPTTGFLDLDQNAAAPFTDDPIEHVRWNTTKPPPGRYQVGVHGYAIRSAGVQRVPHVPFTVEIKSPDGVRSYSGSVSQDDFEEIDTLLIGISKERQQNLETQAERLLFTAKEQLDSGDERAIVTARGILKNVERRFPSTRAAAQARELLRITQ